MFGSILVKAGKMVPESKIIFLTKRKKLAFRLKDVVFMITPRTADSYNLYILGKITTISPDSKSYDYFVNVYKTLQKLAAIEDQKL